MSNKESIKKCLVDLFEHYEKTGTEKDWENYNILCQELGVLIVKGKEQ